MAQRFSYDDVYKVYAWREDNVAKLVLTQGEGLSDSASSFSNTYVKTAKFQLRDDQGIIVIPSDTAATLALRKNDGSEALIEMFTSYTNSAGLTADKNNGIVTFAIKRSMTDVAGEMNGEIRLTTSTGIIKFYGIRFFVCDGVSNSAAEQSEAFSALVAQTNKIEALLENADSFGNLTNLDNTIAQGGTHPATSGVIYDYLHNNFVKYETINSSTLNNTNTHLDTQTIYRYGSQGLILAANDDDEEAQYYFAQDGSMRYRYRKKVNGVWEEWDSQFIRIETTENKVNSIDSNSTNNQYPTAKAVYDYAAMVKNAVSNSVSSLPDNSVKLDDATDPRIIYRYVNNGAFQGLIIPAATSLKQSQYYFGEDGILRYRQRNKVNGVWEEWDSQFTTMETTQNKTTTIDNSSTNNQYPTAKAVYDNTIKFATITSEQLFDTDTHLDPQTIYRFGSQGIIIPATNNSNKETQYYFAEDGIMRYRYRIKSNGEWQDWIDGNNFYSIINQENLGKNLNPYLSPQNKLDKYFVKTCIDKSKVKLNRATKILGFGDSIMATSDGGSWMEILKNRVGCPSPINKAVGGAQFANNGTNLLSTQLSNFETQVDNNQIDASSINLIIVAGGTNDAYNGTPINTFQSAVNTFFSDLQTVFSERQLTCPPILIITPIRRGKESEINEVSDDNLELKIAKYSAVLNNLALKAGFSVINGFDIPVLVDDMTIKGVSSETATITSLMLTSTNGGSSWDDILHVHPNSTSGRATYAQAVINAIGFELLDSSITQNGNNPATSGAIYDFANSNFTKYQGINASDVDTSVDHQTLYFVHYQGLYSTMYCVSGTAHRVQYLYKSTGDVLYRYQGYDSTNQVWGDWDEWKLVSTQNYRRRSTAPSTNTDGKLWDIRWCNDGTKEHCYQLTSIGGTAANPVYNWTELISKDVLDSIITQLQSAITNKIVVFTYTLDKDDWSNKQQAVDLPVSYVATGDTIADVDFNTSAYNQLVADGCTGIYISSTYSNSTLLLTANALGNTPVHDISIQVTLTAVTDMSA